VFIVFVPGILYLLMMPVIGLAYWQAMSSTLSGGGSWAWWALTILLSIVTFIAGLIIWIAGLIMFIYGLRDAWHERQ